MTFLSQIIVIFSFKLLKCSNITDSFSVENLIVGNTTYSDNVSWSIPEETFISNITESPFDNNTTAINLSWLTNAIRDVAYYLRAHKFNEYDRRYEKKPKNPAYFAAYPKPPLRSLHWEVQKYCELSFIHCMEYLNKRVSETTLRREDDTSHVIKDQQWTFEKNSNQINSTEATCKELKRRDDLFAAPFEGPLERFQWRTTASYYMCWYTMNQVPELQHFGESCDNYARCLDSNYGINNKDPRASDAEPFFCAIYSSCPDPCCPLRHITKNSECLKIKQNPCFKENNLNEMCVFDKTQNKDFRNIVLNRWNVSCQCDKIGYVWESRYGICVDINECTTNAHDCDATTEVCLNLPGTYRCACNWGYVWNKKISRCSISEALTVLKRVRLEKDKIKNTKAKSLIKTIYYKIFGKSFAISSSTNIILVSFLNFCGDTMDTNRNWT